MSSGQALHRQGWGRGGWRHVGGVVQYNLLLKGKSCHRKRGKWGASSQGVGSSAPLKIQRLALREDGIQSSSRSLQQWVSTFSLHWNHLEGLLNHRLLGSTQSPNKFPGDTDAVGPRTTLESGYPTPSKDLSSLLNRKGYYYSSFFKDGVHRSPYLTYSKFTKPPLKLY